MRAAMKRVLARVSAIDIAAWSGSICTSLAKTMFNQPGATRAAMLFAPMPGAGEPDLRALALDLRHQGVTVCIPRVDWLTKTMTPVAISDWDADIFLDVRGVPMPREHCPPVPVADLGIVLVPGLAFDDARFRLGRGGGFYDRFLSDPSLRAPTVGVCFHMQRVRLVPREAHDTPVDHVVTERFGDQEPSPLPLSSGRG
jgi:5-formyltetrahydrofolate cyclo-ligase